MSGRKRKTTKAEKNIDKEVLNIPRQYDSDTIEGEGWKKCFDDILNKRFFDGWEYIPPYILVEKNLQKSGAPNIYMVLYKKYQPTERVHPALIKR